MIFIDACKGKATKHTPIWLMRQAGRYLPQYRDLRASVGDFLALCKDSQKAAQATLQPISELNVDAAIIFSDILVLPLEMGMSLSFKPGIGPVFSEPINDLKALDKLSADKAIENLNYVYDALKITREQLSPDKALIGFCGAPWTLATYMVEGSGSKNYANVKKMLYSNPQLLHSMLRKITNALKGYISAQINAGADAIQIFDSWAGALEMNAYLEFAWSYISELCDYIRKNHPNTAIIVFPKGVGAFIENLQADYDVLGISWDMPLKIAKDKMGTKYVLQGNLEPCRLYDTMAIEDGVDEILNIMRGKRHIFNLGHGILPDIPVKNARYLIDYVREKSAKIIAKAK